MTIWLRRIAAAVLTHAFAIQPAAARIDSPLTIDGYSCRALLRESGTDRYVAVAFLHGNILGKSGTNTLDVSVLRKQSAAFIDHCIDDQTATALDTMRGVGSASR